MNAAQAATAPARRLGPVVQYALLAGPLLSMIDSSIVNVAVEPIARELRASLTTVGWTVSGYLLALGTGLAATPYLSRRFGTLPAYRASVVAFTLASGACAAAPGIGWLLAARVVQGLVAAPLVPLAMSMLVGALAAVAAGTIPAGLAPGRDERARLDLPGLILLAAGLALLLLGISQAGRLGWASAAAWIPLAAGAALLAGYAGWAFRADHPALDLALARRPQPALALSLCALASVVTFAAVFLLPVFVQSVQGHSALATGLAMLPQGVLTGAGTALGQRVLTRFSVRGTVLAGFAVLTAASAGLLAIDARTPLT